VVISVQRNIKLHRTRDVTRHETLNFIDSDGRRLHTRDGANTTGHIIRIKEERPVHDHHTTTSFTARHRKHALNLGRWHESEGLQIRCCVLNVDRQLHLRIAEVVCRHLAEHEPRRHDVRYVVDHGDVRKGATSSIVKTGIHRKMLTLYRDESAAKGWPGLR